MSRPTDSERINRELAEIAKTELGLETLDTRNSDALDFHDLAVWTIKRALVAAYEAGVSASKPSGFAADLDRANAMGEDFDEDEESEMAERQNGQDR